VVLLRSELASLAVEDLCTRAVDAYNSKYQGKKNITEAFKWDEASFIYMSDLGLSLPEVLDPNMLTDKPVAIENILKGEIGAKNMAHDAESDESVKAALHSAIQKLKTGLSSVTVSMKKVKVCRLDGSKRILYLSTKVSLLMATEDDDHGVYIAASPGEPLCFSPFFPCPVTHTHAQ
jgi:hypothetical protein